MLGFGVVGRAFGVVGRRAGCIKLGDVGVVGRNAGWVISSLWGVSGREPGVDGTFNVESGLNIWMLGVGDIDLERVLDFSDFSASGGRGGRGRLIGGGGGIIILERSDLGLIRAGALILAVLAAGTLGKASSSVRSS